MEKNNIQWSDNVSPDRDAGLEALRSTRGNAKTANVQRYSNTVSVHFDMVDPPLTRSEQLILLHTTFLLVPPEAKKQRRHPITTCFENICLFRQQPRRAVKDSVRIKSHGCSQTVRSSSNCVNDTGTELWMRWVFLGGSQWNNEKDNQK